MLHGIVERLTNDKLNKKLPNFTCYFFIVILFATIGMKRSGAPNENIVQNHHSIVKSILVFKR